MLEAQALGFVLGRSPLGQSALLGDVEMLDRPSHAGALSLLETWHNHAPRGGMIVGRDFPVRRHAALLPNVMLFEKCDGDFRVRLAGFAMLRFHGCELRGKRLSEICGTAHRECFAQLDDVLAAGRPHVARSRLRLDPDTVLERETVSVPVTASDGRTPLVMAVSFWTRPN